MRREATLLSLVVTALTAMSAQARPLDLSELYDFGRWLACGEACPDVTQGSPYLDHVARQECLAACGFAPRLWEKNGIAPVDRADHELALLEFYDVEDTTRQLVCYADADETIVIPAALCSGAVCEAVPVCTDEACAADPDATLTCVDDLPGGPRCIWPTTKRPAHCPDVVCDAEPVRSFQQCADGDTDGLPKWLEQHLGSDDGVVETRCGANSVCGFSEQCVYDTALGTSRCVTRDCGGACTAFHLELVAEDDVEVLVHLHYDYTPIPARALDLYLTYDRATLTLEDSRALRPLSQQGKEVATTHLSDGTLRVSVFDTQSSHPIPTGPIIELVFRRTADVPVTIGFATDDTLQGLSVAPMQGDRLGQGLLSDDSVWGSPIELLTRTAAPTTMRMWYGFDALEAPISYLNVPDAETLCRRYPRCANEPDPVQRAVIVSRLEALQEGSLVAAEPIDGITNGAVYLDGDADHARLPIHFEEPLAPSSQSMSLSTWFYTEGNSPNELKQTPQIIYAHNGSNERTRFGLVLVTSPSGGMDLSLFDGDFLSQAPRPTFISIARNIPLRTWHHVGFALDADQGKVDLYFDGERVAAHTFQRQPVVVCPQLRVGVDVIPHIEGDILGGKSPEGIYYAANRSNLYAIERMDPTGLNQTTVIGDREFSYRDPDFHPGLDRILYSGNASGDAEIWIAKGDGSDRRQVTIGFGDAERGIAARRPRWAPDGSGFVFESDVYDVLAQDNTFRRVTHLYYVAYDAVDNTVAIELADGTTSETLDYDALLANQTTSTYRLTDVSQEHHHRNAHWLTGLADDGTRGELVFEVSSPTFEQGGLRRLEIPEIIDLASYDIIPGLGSPSDELSLFAAYHGETTGLVPIVTELALYERSRTTYPPTSDFALQETADATGVTVRVLHTPTGTPSHEVRNLYVEYDAAIYRARIEDDAGVSQTPGQVLIDQNKTLRLKTVEPFGRSYVRVEVMSPLDATALLPGEIAVLRFERVDVDAQTVPFGVFTRTAESEQVIKDLTNATQPTAFVSAGLYEQLDDATFAPDGKTVLLSAVSRSRPVLLRTETLLGASGASPLMVEPIRLGGLDWEREERFYACNWMGGVEHLQHKHVLSSLRGGLDDLKVYAGLRDPDAFRSEAERGHERLAVDGRDGVLESMLPSCGNNHAECPAYHLCVDSECVMVPCDPTDAMACSQEQARCTLRPMSIEQENTGPGGDTSAFDWVCSADCNVDAECFSKACLNGPCRFCEVEDHTCIECREVVRQLGAVTISTIEGCPDTKSFACEAGACVTECYAFEDGESIYLCDPALEYCDKGRCVMHEWSWWDFAPGGFGGTGTPTYDVPTDPMNGWPGYAQAVDQRIPIAIQAYGTSDYGQAPELVVEARGGPFYKNNWTRLGRVLVHNTTTVEAQQAPYVVNSPHPFNELRMRLITAPYNNLTGAAGGLRDKDDQFCLDDFAATATLAGTPNASPDACYFEAQGSAYTVGYPVDLPAHEAMAYCRARGHAGCPTLSQGEHDFMMGGNAAVAVLEVTVDGGGVMNNITRNRVCTYEGTLVPLDQGLKKKVFYGDIRNERSNERDVFCAEHPDVCAAGSSLVEFDRATYGYALLNCNVVDPTGADNAELVFQNIILIKDFPLEAGAILETANNCTVDIDAFRVEPCYTWTGGDSSVDPHNAADGTGSSVVFASFEFGLFKNFGHDDGFERVAVPTATLSVRALNYTGSGLRLGWRDSRGAIAETIEVPAGTNEVAFPTPLKSGRRYEVFIASQPTPASELCVVGSALAYGTIPESGAVVPVVCGRTQLVNVAVQGLTGTLLLTNTYRFAVTEPVAGVDDLAITSNGVTPFADRLPAGSLYAVGIARQPAGQLCTVLNPVGLVGNGAAGVVVTCRDVVSAPLSVSVSGLTGSGLQVIERNSGRLLSVTSDGVVPFPGVFVEGSAYDIGVVAQPRTPAQVCTIGEAHSGQTGVSPTTGAEITCATLPTYAVTGRIAGLSGTGLVLDLNGVEKLPVTSAVGTGEFTFTFQTRLLDQQTYKVTVFNAPSAPSQVCDVVMGEGRIDGGDTELMMIGCRPPSPTTETYEVHGVVSGLRGSGLQLQLNGGTQRLEVGQNGAFTIGSLQPGDTFNLKISRQPQQPTQVCTVTNGSGVIAHADVTNVAVSCVDAMNVNVEVQLGANGAHVKALLVSVTSPPQLVARSPDGVRLANGRVSFVMQGLDDTSDAAVAPGRYQLYVFVNKDLDYNGSTGAPNFEPLNDLGAVVVVEGTASQPPSVVISPELAPLSYGNIVVSSPNLPDNASVRCWLATAGAGALALPPVDRFVPVIGSSTRTCSTSVCVTNANNSRTLQTNLFTPVPAGVAYDASCWVDVNRSDTVDTGDLFGFRASVSTTSPINIPLNLQSF